MAYSKGDKIRPFVNCETGLLLLLHKTENLPLQLMQRRMIAISVTRFCARTNYMLKMDLESAGSKAKYASSMIQNEITEAP